MSQLAFRDDLCDEICTSHPEYLARGVQQTSLSGGDFLFGADFQNSLINTQKNIDGSMLAFKAIQVIGI